MGAVRRSLWTRIVFAFGRLHNCFQGPLLTIDDRLQVTSTVRPGDILAAYTRRYASTLLIPGRFKHTAIYVGGGYVVHAVAPRVMKIMLTEFLSEYDRIAVWRPKYEACSSWKATDRAAFCQLSHGYDALFSPNNGVWYCHEFVAHCLQASGLIVPMSGPQYLADDVRVVCDPGGGAMKKRVPWEREEVAAGCVLVAIFVVCMVNAMAADRSGKWPAVRAAYWEAHPTCEACGAEPVEIHHVHPFHLWPESELDPANLVALCDDCHRLIGHLGNYKAYNPLVREYAARFKAMVDARPMTKDDEDRFKQRFALAP